MLQLMRSGERANRTRWRMYVGGMGKLSSHLHCSENLMAANMWTPIPKKAPLIKRFHYRGAPRTAPFRVRLWPRSESQSTVCPALQVQRSLLWQHETEQEQQVAAGRALSAFGKESMPPPAPREAQGQGRGARSGTYLGVRMG